MRKLYKKHLFWIILIIVFIIIVSIIISNNTVDGLKGGILEGPTHKQGGIKGIIKGNGKTVIMEGNEDVLTKNVNKIKDTYVCEGTPGGIASALNVEAGGIEFDRSGSCRLK